MLGAAALPQGSGAPIPRCSISWHLPCTSSRGPRSSHSRILSPEPVPPHMGTGSRLRVRSAAHPLHFLILYPLGDVTGGGAVLEGRRQHCTLALALSVPCKHASATTAHVMHTDNVCLTRLHRADTSLQRAGSRCATTTASALGLWSSESHAPHPTGGTNSAELRSSPPVGQSGTTLPRAGAFTRVHRLSPFPPEPGFDRMRACRGTGPPRCSKTTLTPRWTPIRAALGCAVVAPLQRSVTDRRAVPAPRPPTLGTLDQPHRGHLARTLGPLSAMQPTVASIVTLRIAQRTILPSRRSGAVRASIQGPMTSISAGIPG